MKQRAQLGSSCVYLVMLALLAPFLMTPALAATAVGGSDLNTPNDARARIVLAERTNGLRLVDVPWHLKASYVVFADGGTTSDAGTYEEWRVSEKEYRVALHSSSLSVEEFGTAHGVFRVGQGDWPREPLSSITSMIAGPSFPHISDDTVLENFQHSFGASKLTCTAVRKRSEHTTLTDFPSYCFSPTDAVLLYTSSANAASQTVFEHFKTMRGHYLAFDTKQYLEDKLWLKLHVETLEGLDKAGQSALELPAGAVPVTPRSHLLGLAPDRLVSKVDPVYPVAARMHQFQGTVVLDALIDKAGHVAWLRALSGLPSLQQPALDAVRHWAYKPYLVEGQPAEVETEIPVTFVLNGHQVLQ